MKKIFIRLIYGLLFAMPLVLLSFALAQAGDVQPQAKTFGPTKLSCPACHQAFQKSWEQSSHATAGTNPAFQQAWDAQGKKTECLSCHMTGYDADTNTWKAEGVSCQACHDTDTADHPAKPMTADHSSKVCGNCHSETYFEWQGSAHRKAGITCISCHDPHATGLKAKNASEQCATCHKDRSTGFAHTQHNQQGLTCADCHLVKITDPLINGHGRRDHSFSVRLATCNQCHSYQMHDPSQVHAPNPTPQPPDPGLSVEKASIIPEPAPVSPYGFSLLAGLIGFAAGIVLAPWLERWQRGKEKSED